MDILERLPLSLEDIPLSTTNETTQKGPSITALPTDTIVGIFDQVETTTRSPNFIDLSDSCLCSCTITRTDCALRERADSLINADTHTVGNP